MSHVLIRPARLSDVSAMSVLAAESYHELDQRTFQREWPDPVMSPPEARTRWQARTAAALATDPDGCWVAEIDGITVGFVVSRIRELMWILGSFAVRTDLQGRGVGHQLLAAAMHYGRGCLRGMFAASADPKAVRRYRLAGFSVHPQMLVTGVVDRTQLPLTSRVREGSAGDIDLLNSIDRQTRGAAHLSDHELLQSQARLIVVDDSKGSGYAYVDETGAPSLVAATHRRTASTLMWEALASAPPGGVVGVHHITAANEWAIDVGMAARLSLHQSGYLCVRQMKPPSPYLHHGSLL